MNPLNKFLCFFKGKVHNFLATFHFSGDIIWIVNHRSRLSREREREKERHKDDLTSSSSFGINFKEARVKCILVIDGFCFRFKLEKSIKAWLISPLNKEIYENRISKYTDAISWNVLFIESSFFVTCSRKINTNLAQWPISTNEIENSFKFKKQKHQSNNLVSNKRKRFFEMTTISLFNWWLIREQNTRPKLKSIQQLTQSLKVKRTPRFQCFKKQKKYFFFSFSMNMIILVDMLQK